MTMMLSARMRCFQYNESVTFCCGWRYGPEAILGTGFSLSDGRVRHRVQRPVGRQQSISSTALTTDYYGSGDVDEMA